MEITKCAILGYPLKAGELKPFLNSTIEYETEFVGQVRITVPAYQQLLLGDYDIPAIAGICKNRTLQNETPILIDSNFLNESYKKISFPADFDEKCYHLLKVLYQMGGNVNKAFELNSTKDFPLAYSDPEEFCRIVDQLETEYKISINKTHNLASGGGRKIYTGVKLTRSGKEDAIKALPKMPLFGLISQAITTGNLEVDEKIDHARVLFFSEPLSMDKMRSACETLCFVLEPLREDLKNYFSQKDVSDFFQIVNSFDIRHNKEVTKNLIHEEQLEWVFYSLLNTINTYVKLKNKQS